jgi:hypothetical protein
MGYAPDGRQITESVGGHPTAVSPDKPVGKPGRTGPSLHPKLKQAIALFPEKSVVLQAVGTAAL